MRRFFTLVCVLLSAACQKPPPTMYPTSTPAPTSTPRPDWNDLNGTRWMLIELLGKPALPDAPVTLEFVDNSLKGDAGCNQYWQSLGSPTHPDAVEDGMSFAITVQLCHSTVLMKQEEAYIKQLSLAGNIFVLDDENLVVKNRSGETILVFVIQ